LTLKTFSPKWARESRYLNSIKISTCSSKGDVAGAVFYIPKRKVKVTVQSEHGKEAVVGILGPGQFFGEGCMNGHKLRISTTTAMDDSVINFYYQRRDVGRPS